MQNWGPHGILAIEFQRDSAYWRVIEILHFCFTPIMGAVRWNRVYHQKREEIKCCATSEAGELAAALDPVLDLAQISGNSRDLRLHTFVFICSLLEPLHSIHQMLNLHYYCGGSRNTNLNCRRMHYSNCR